MVTVTSRVRGKGQGQGKELDVFSKAWYISSLLVLQVEGTHPNTERAIEKRTKEKKTRRQISFDEKKGRGSTWRVLL